MHINEVAYRKAGKADTLGWQIPVDYETQREVQMPKWVMDAIVGGYSQFKPGRWFVMPMEDLTLPKEERFKNFRLVIDQYFRLNYYRLDRSMHHPDEFVRWDDMREFPEGFSPVDKELVYPAGEHPCHYHTWHHLVRGKVGYEIDKILNAPKWALQAFAFHALNSDLISRIDPEKPSIYILVDRLGGTRIASSYQEFSSNFKKVPPVVNEEPPAAPASFTQR
jgi:hypothetical protein